MRILFHQARINCTAIRHERHLVLLFVPAPVIDIFRERGRRVDHRISCQAAVCIPAEEVVTFNSYVWNPVTVTDDHILRLQLGAAMVDIHLYRLEASTRQRTTEIREGVGPYLLPPLGATNPVQVVMAHYLRNDAALQFGFGNGPARVLVTARFKVEHVLDDVRVILREAAKHGLDRVRIAGTDNLARIVGVDYGYSVCSLVANHPANIVRTDNGSRIVHIVQPDPNSSVIGCRTHDAAGVVPYRLDPRSVEAVFDYYGSHPRIGGPRDTTCRIARTEKRAHDADILDNRIHVLVFSCMEALEKARIGPRLAGEIEARHRMHLAIELAIKGPYRSPFCKICRIRHIERAIGLEHVLVDYDVLRELAAGSSIVREVDIAVHDGGKTVEFGHV